MRLDPKTHLTGGIAPTEKSVFVAVEQAPLPCSKLEIKKKPEPVSLELLTLLSTFHFPLFPGPQTCVTTIFCAASRYGSNNALEM